MARQNVSCRARAPGGCRPSRVDGYGTQRCALGGHATRTNSHEKRLAENGPVVVAVGGRRGRHVRALDVALDAIEPGGREGRGGAARREQEALAEAPARANARKE